MERDYELQHQIIMEKFFNNAHEFKDWFCDTGIIKKFIEKEYDKLCIVNEKEKQKSSEWINISTAVKNKFHFIIIDFGESKESGMCSKIVLSNYRKPHYFTVEKREDYLYYLCEWKRGTHKVYFSVVNQNEYIVDRIAAGVMKK
ncbi:hypothetical protein EOM82_08745 [bacterium]|nr:hypothetical protein [bacterium]